VRMHEMPVVRRLLAIVLARERKSVSAATLAARD